MQATKPIHSSPAILRGSRLGGGMLAAGLLAALGACQQTTHHATSTPPEHRQAIAGTPSIHEAINTFKQGKTDHAVAQLIDIAQGESPDESLLLYRMTEAEFAKAHETRSTADAESYHQSVLDELSLARQLVIASLRAGDAALEAGRFEEAALHYNAAQQFGKANDRDETIHAARATGKAILDAANARIARASTQIPSGPR